MFNPRPRIESVPIDATHAVFVIDDALAEPERWVELAARHAHAFEEAPHNAFPGPELRMPEAISAELDAYFARHVRARLGVRRTLRMYSRLALVARAPDALQPRQWLPHRDRLGMASDELAAASVLYLFRDRRFGGTSFFAARRPSDEIERLIADSDRDDAATFAAKYRLRRGYCSGSNAWFEHLVTIEPRFNRLIFYDGSVFHTSHVPDAEALSADPRRGRLTLNGFFTCRRAAR